MKMKFAIHYDVRVDGIAIGIFNIYFFYINCVKFTYFRTLDRAEKRLFYTLDSPFNNHYVFLWVRFLDLITTFGMELAVLGTRYGLFYC